MQLRTTAPYVHGPLVLLLLLLCLESMQQLCATNLCLPYTMLHMFPFECAVAEV